jgi:hypothetical protein
MKVPIAILLEALALALAVAAVVVAVGRVWPSLLAGAAAVAYAAHAWDFEDGAVTLRPLSLGFLRRRAETDDAE